MDFSRMPPERKIKIAIALLSGYGIFAVILGLFESLSATVPASDTGYLIDYRPLFLSLLVLAGSWLLAGMLYFRVRIGYWLTVIVSVLALVAALLTMYQILMVPALEQNQVVESRSVALTVIDFISLFIISSLTLLMLLPRSARVLFNSAPTA